MNNNLENQSNNNKEEDKDKENKQEQAKESAETQEQEKEKTSIWEKLKNIDSKTAGFIAKKVGKVLSGSAASFFGVKSLYDVPAYFYQRYQVRGGFGEKAQENKGLKGSVKVAFEAYHNPEVFTEELEQENKRNREDEIVEINNMIEEAFRGKKKVSSKYLKSGLEKFFNEERGAKNIEAIKNFNESLPEDESISLEEAKEKLRSLSLEKASAKEGQESRSEQGKQINMALNDLNKRLKLTKEGDKKGSEQRQKVAKLLNELRQNKDIDMEKVNEEVQIILDDYTTTKVTGVQAIKETLNTALVASGAMGLRGAVYTGVEAFQRKQKLEKEARKEVREKGTEKEKVSWGKDVVMEGLKKTFEGAFKKEEGTFKEKFSNKAKNWGHILRFAGIGASSFSGNMQEASESLINALKGDTGFADAMENVNERAFNIFSSDNIKTKEISSYGLEEKDLGGVEENKIDGEKVAEMQEKKFGFENNSDQPLTSEKLGKIDQLVGLNNINTINDSTFTVLDSDLPLDIKSELLQNPELMEHYEEIEVLNPEVASVLLKDGNVSEEELKIVKDSNLTDEQKMEKILGVNASEGRLEELGVDPTKVDLTKELKLEDIRNIQEETLGREIPDNTILLKEDIENFRQFPDKEVTEENLNVLRSDYSQEAKAKILNSDTLSKPENLPQFLYATEPVDETLIDSLAEKDTLEEKDVRILAKDTLNTEQKEGLLKEDLKDAEEAAERAGEMSAITETVKEGGNFTYALRRVLESANQDTKIAFIEKVNEFSEGTIIPEEGVNPDNYEELMEKSVNYLSTKGAEEGSGVTNLMYEGNVVKVNSETGQWSVEQGTGKWAPKVVGMEELRPDEPELSKIDPIKADKVSSEKEIEDINLSEEEFEDKQVEEDLSQYQEDVRKGKTEEIENKPEEAKEEPEPQQEVEQEAVTEPEQTPENTQEQNFEEIRAENAKIKEELDNKVESMMGEEENVEETENLEEEQANLENNERLKEFEDKYGLPKNQIKDFENDGIDLSDVKRSQEKWLRVDMEGLKPLEKEEYETMNGINSYCLRNSIDNPVEKIDDKVRAVLSTNDSVRAKINFLKIPQVENMSAENVPENLRSEFDKIKVLYDINNNNVEAENKGVLGKLFSKSPKNKFEVENNLDIKLNGEGLPDHLFEVKNDSAQEVAEYWNNLDPEGKEVFKNFKQLYENYSNTLAGNVEDKKKALADLLDIDKTKIGINENTNVYYLEDQEGNKLPFSDKYEKGFDPKNLDNAEKLLEKRKQLSNMELKLNPGGQEETS